MTLRIDISGLPSERLRFAASPLAELTAMLHVLAEPGHHPQLAGWAGDVWAGLRPEPAERLREAEFLWRSSQADFLLPARPRPTLTEELDDVDRIDDETYVTAALVTTCGGNRGHFATPSPSEPVSLETVTLRLEALAHPVRLRLLRTLARGPHTTGELAHAWELSPPEVSRYLAVLRRAGLLTARRHGRYVRYTLNLADLMALGADLLAAVLR
ncbi:ArsR/SmtB family transcription factor [Streptosporangium canum]|uniref:ArsR/SmtB family transcription factor n=1 Tax=Streptosporangium canum TaxID=324952 RepID=UPI003798AA8E